jgi:hypothetical protein
MTKELLALTLEEELGLRLYRAGLAAGGPSPSTRKRSRFWKAVAAEALRQMEWVRHQCEEDQDYGMPSVTLAPRDWQP